MASKEKLYDAFGEMLYVVAMADGIIQPEETEALQEILKNNTWAKEIVWSFNYELEKHQDVDYLYKKVLDICHEAGPNPEYQYLIEIMEKMANAHAGKKSQEQEVINKFSHDLMQRFQRDLDKI